MNQYGSPSYKRFCAGGRSEGAGFQLQACFLVEPKHNVHVLYGLTYGTFQQVVDSRIWLHRLKQKIVEAKGRGEAVWITIR